MVTGNPNSYAVGAQLPVYEFTSSDCSTGYTGRWWADPGAYDATYGGYWQCCWVDPLYSNEYRPMAGYGIGYCASGDTDPGGSYSHPYCHMPDVWVHQGSESGYRSYLARIYTKVCDNPACSTNCTSAYQEGCFQIYWY